MMSNIKNNAFIGLIWASIGNIGGGLINLLITLILARILSPSDFGVLELVIVITSISVVFVDSGFSQAIIRDKNSTDVDLSTVFIVNLFISCLLYLALFALVPFLSDFWNIKDFTKIGRYAFLVIIFDAVGLIQNVKYTKDLNFKPIAYSVLGSTLLAGIFAIIFAYYGLGVWALVHFLVFASFLKTLFLWLQNRSSLKLDFSRESFCKYYKFGFFLFLQSLVDKIMINVESLIIGRFYTKSQLGFFSQSRKLDSYLGQALTNIVVKVSYPTLVKINNNDIVLKNGYRKIIGLTTFVIAPLMLYLIIFPGLVMEVLFGKQWVEAGIYLRWWAIFGLVHPMQSICNNIFYIKGRSRELLIITIIKQVVKIIAILLFIRVSILSMLQGIIVSSIMMMFVYVIRSGRLISYRLTDVIIDVFPNILSATMCALISSFVIDYLTLNNILLRFITSGAIFCVLYLITAIITRNKSCIEFSLLIKNRFIRHSSDNK